MAVLFLGVLCLVAVFMPQSSAQERSCDHLFVHLHYDLETCSIAINWSSPHDGDRETIEYEVTIINQSNSSFIEQHGKAYTNTTGLNVIFPGLLRLCASGNCLVRVKDIQDDHYNCVQLSADSYKMYQSKTLYIHIYVAILH